MKKEKVFIEAEEEQIGNVSEEKKAEKLDFMDDPAIMLKAAMIEANEDMIDRDEKVYLITWSPDPKEFMDCSFNLQHETHISVVSDYLKFCSAGLFCVESTQLGNPHYHGWYQINEETELGRIAIMKVMKRFGDVKLDTHVKNYKINNYDKHCNALYYYKKDLFGSMREIDQNPITRYSYASVDFKLVNLVNFFRVGRVKHKIDLKAMLDNRDFYRSFYKDSLTHFN